MYPGGRGMNPKQMKAMMRKQGIDMDTIEGVEEVIVRTRDREIVFRRPEVTTISAQGTVTYQIVGRPEERARTAEGAAANMDDGEGAVPAPAALYSEDDVGLVMAQTGVPDEQARAALDACNGEVAEAIMKLIS
ncbi:MAG: nascent polypeptide-associated complex protein [Thermoplasmata archaeon]|nr:nascent polypeptide-associated complex protein [Thermoplasmata archaeon]